MKLFLGVYREPEHSPGHHVLNDRLILHLTARALEREGARVELHSFEAARDRWRQAASIFSMVRQAASLQELARWQACGVKVFNSPRAVQQTLREQLCPLLSRDGVPFPSTVFLASDPTASVEAYRPLFAGGAVWVKRADIHKACSDDVLRVDSWSDLPSALERFERRGLRRVALQAHCEGDEVKFYGVRGGRLFWPYYPAECTGYPFDEHELRRIAEHAADLLGLDIYGGDAIVAPDGTITLIDLNDWPSFAPCRGAAAHAIARHLIERSA